MCNRWSSVHGRLAILHTTLPPAVYITESKYCDRNMSFVRNVQQDKRDTMCKQQRKNMSDGQVGSTYMDSDLRHILSNTVPRGRAIMFAVAFTVEVFTMATRHCRNIFETGVDGAHVTRDHMSQTQKHVYANDPNVAFPHFRPLEAFLLQDGSMTIKRVLVADTGNSPKWSERSVDVQLLQQL